MLFLKILDKGRDYGSLECSIWTAACRCPFLQQMQREKTLYQYRAVSGERQRKPAGYLVDLPLSGLRAYLEFRGIVSDFM